MNPYAAQARLSQLPDDASSPKTLVLGILLIECVWWAGGAILLRPVYAGLFGEGTALQALLGLMSSVVLWMAVGLALRMLQNRNWRSLLAPFSAARSDFMAVATWAGAVMLGLTLLSIWPHLEDASFTRPLWQWLLVLPFLLAATFVQITGEELYFRGFLQSTLAARYDSPMVWALLPAIAFGLIHIPNAQTGAEALQIVIYITFFGVFAADLTARTGTLGAAMGFHFAHNLVIFSLYSVEGAPEAALALWVFPDPAGASETTPPVFDAVMVIQTVFLLIELTLFWIAARIAVRA